MKYWVVIENTQKGPFSLDELKEHSLTPNTLVWHEGLSQWVAAKEVKDVMDLIVKKQQVPPAIPVQQILDVEAGITNHDEKPLTSDEKSQIVAIEDVESATETVFETQQPQPSPQPQQCQAPYSAEQPVNNSWFPTEPCPPTNLVWAIICTILCCQIFGIIGIVYAAQVKSLYIQGNIDGARKASKNSLMWSIIGMCVGIIGWIIYISFFFVDAVLSNL